MSNIPKCPKCKKKPFVVTEIFSSNQYYKYNEKENKYYPAGQDVGDSVSAFAKCECGHEWKLRCGRYFVYDDVEEENPHALS